MDKWQKENQNTRPSEGENMGAEPSLKSPPSNLAEQVKTGDEKGQVKQVLEADNFNDLYSHISQQVKTGKLKPSIPTVKKAVHGHVKQNSSIKSSSVSLPECAYLTMQIRDRMLEEGIIKNNPNYKNGLPKYLVA